MLRASRSERRSRSTPASARSLDWADDAASRLLDSVLCARLILLALPREEREKLLEALMENTVPADIPPLLREFVASTERTNRALEVALERLSRLDETIVRNRAEVREAVRKSGEVWPFPLPHP